MNIVIKKADLIDQLKALRPKFDKQDQDAKKKYEQDKKAALAEFREKLRAALKEPYDEAVKHAGYQNGLRVNQPTCPMSKLHTLNGVIKRLEIDQRQKLTIGPKNDFSTAYEFLTEGTKPRSLCAKENADA